MNEHHIDPKNTTDPAPVGHAAHADVGAAQALVAKTNQMIQHTAEGLQQYWLLSTVTAIVMVLLSLLGIAITNAAKEYAQRYWLALGMIFGALCLFTAWNKARHTHSGDPYMVHKQLLHWFGLLGALCIDFLIPQSQTESGQSAGYNALLLLALACYLAGVHFEWRFILVGVLLTFTLYSAVEANKYAWMVVVVGIIAMIVLLARWWWLRHKAHTVVVHAQHAAAESTAS